MFVCPPRSVVYWDGKQHNHESLERQVETAESLLAVALEKDAATMSATIDAFSRNPEIRAAFAARDRVVVEQPSCGRLDGQRRESTMLCDAYPAVGRVL
jgi:hypothetical protein